MWETKSLSLRETATYRRTLRHLVVGAVVLAQILTPAMTLARDATPVPEAAGCTAGSSGISDPYFPLLGNSGYDVQHYTLDLELDVAGSAIAAARSTIDAVALLNLCTFNLDFRGLEIDSITVDAQSAPFSRHGGELTIEPWTPLTAGTRFTTEIAYHGVPIEQEAPTVGKLILTNVGALLNGGGAEQKPGPEEGEQYLHTA